MWLPLTLAAIGSLLVVGGLLRVLENVGDIFTTKPMESIEQLALYAMGIGAALIVVAIGMTLEPLA